MYKRTGALNKGFVFRPTLIAKCIAVSIAATAPLSSFAFNFDTGNPDLDLTWDNTIRYNAGWRMGQIDPAFYDTIGFDETEGRFRRGDMVTDRVDLLTEFEAIWKKDYGFRASAAGWYDAAYSSKSKENPMFGGYSGNYVDDTYNSYTKRYILGPAAETLDVFAFGKFELGDTQLNLKVGKHNEYWGESLFSIGNSIAYSQSPVDTIKAATSPGAEAKELFMPLNQISAQWQVTPKLSFAAQYLLDWKPFRLVPGGTFFAPGDGSRSDYATAPAAAAAGAWFDNGPDLTPKKTGDFGVNMRASPDWLNGTVGVYYRHFDEKLPWSFLAYGGGTTPGTAGAIRLNYARDTQLFGLSLNKTVGVISVGSEVSVRKNTALNSTQAFVTGPDPTYDQAEGARGNTLHALVNGIYLLPETPLWVGGSLTAELSYQHLLHVTQNEPLYFACNGGTKSSGCSTRDSMGMNVSFAPEWPQAVPGWDLSMPTSVGYGIAGNGAALAGTNQGAVSYSLGLDAKFHQVYEFSMTYIASRASYSNLNSNLTNGEASQNSHNWLSLMFKTTF